MVVIISINNSKPNAKLGIKPEANNPSLFTGYLSYAEGNVLKNEPFWGDSEDAIITSAFVFLKAKFSNATIKEVERR